MKKFSLKLSLSRWRRKLDYRARKLHVHQALAHKGGTHRVTHEEAALIHKWERLVVEAQKMVALRERQIANDQPLRLRALTEMEKLVGIMEVGGNNMGKRVMEIIHANGGSGPEAWCGDTVAYAYRRAGSKVVQRGWAAVRLLGFLTGMRIVPLSQALPGDIICYKFDHTGILRKKISATEWETIEGNTGASGAVSDSATGGDGVYIKRRTVGLIARTVRVTR